MRGTIIKITKISTPNGVDNFGAPAGTRTQDTRLKRAVLYLLSYWGLWQGWRDSNPRMQESKSCALPLGDIPISQRNLISLTPPNKAASMNGVGKGTRTLDTRNHNPVL